LITTNGELEEQLNNANPAENLLVIVRARVLEFLVEKFLKDLTDAVVTVPFNTVADGLCASSNMTAYPRDIVARAFATVRDELIHLEFNLMRTFADDNRVFYDPYIPCTISEGYLAILSQKYEEYQKRLQKVPSSILSLKETYTWRMFLIEKVIESVSSGAMPFYTMLRQEFLLRKPQSQLSHAKAVDNFIIIWCYATGNDKFTKKRA
jgi:hypothetical protein